MVDTVMDMSSREGALLGERNYARVHKIHQHSTTWDRRLKDRVYPNEMSFWSMMHAIAGNITDISRLVG